MKADLTLQPPVILKGILETMFIILMIGLIGGAITTLYFLLFQEDEISFEVLNYTIEYLNPRTVSLIIFQIVLKVLFAYLIYLFRNLVRDFTKDKFYSLSQIKILRKIGRLIIALSIGKALLGFLAGLVIRGSGRLSVEIEFLDSFWFTLALGLFFVYLSKIFENAKALREENELTV